MSTNDVVTPSVSERLTGRVKWFNNKAGYGFITITDGPQSGNDIFTHHSSINVENQQYKYLVQGEYVEFSLTKTTSGNHEYQASDVSGIKGGKLMCETRREFKIARSNYKSTDEVVAAPRQQRVPRESTDNEAPRQRRAPRPRGEGPRESKEEKKEWTLVTNKAASKPRGRKPKPADEAK
jgi:cold shock CspA family protein